MRIWAFPSFYPYDYPGLTYAGIFAHRQYKGLIQNGAELNVIVPINWSPPYPISQLHPEWRQLHAFRYPLKRVYDGINVYHPRISNKKPNRFEKKSYDERYVDAIVSFFKKKKIALDPLKDVFYSQWLPSSYLVQLAAHQLGVKSAILSIGDDVVLWPYWKKENMELFKETLRGAAFRFTCADYLGKLANSTLGENLSYEVVRMGAEYDFFKPVSPAKKAELRKEYNIPNDKIVILNIGTASVRKGWLDLLDALGHLKRVSPDFVLIGVYTGRQEFSFKEEVAKRGLEDHFLDLGEVAPAALNKLFNTADIFCLPSHSEGIANVVIEAMSSGLPVITTNVCGHPELVNSGVTGILIPPQEPKPLFESLTALVNNSALRAKLGASARAFIVNEWGNYAHNAKILYEKLRAGLAS